MDAISKKGTLNTPIKVVILVLVLIILAFITFKYVEYHYIPIGPETPVEWPTNGTILDFQIDNPLTVKPERLMLAKGQSKIIMLTFANFGNETVTASATVSTKSKLDDLTCTFEKTGTISSDLITIPLGEFKTLKVLVDSKKTGTAGNKVCKFVAKGLGENTQQALIVTVI